MNEERTGTLATTPGDPPDMSPFTRPTQTPTIPSASLPLGSTVTQTSPSDEGLSGAHQAAPASSAPPALMGPPPPIKTFQGVQKPSEYISVVAGSGSLARSAMDSSDGSQTSSSRFEDASPASSASSLPFANPDQDAVMEETAAGGKPDVVAADARNVADDVEPVAGPSSARLEPVVARRLPGAGGIRKLSVETA